MMMMMMIIIIVQLVEHCTSIAQVRVLIPLQACFLASAKEALKTSSNKHIHLFHNIIIIIIIIITTTNSTLLLLLLPPGYDYCHARNSNNSKEGVGKLKEKQVANEPWQ